MALKPAYLLIEALVAAAMLGIVLAALLPTLSLLNTQASRSSFTSEATLLLSEGLEVAYNVSLAGWTGLAPGTYRATLDVVPPQHWVLTPAASELLNAKFTRTIQVQSVCRSSPSGAIADCAAFPLDPKSKSLSVNISWEEPSGPKHLDSQLLIYNYD